MTIHCKGCLTNEYCDDYGNDILTKYNSEGGCPCTLCIVKPMCEQICGDFFNFKLELDNEKIKSKRRYSNGPL